MEAPEGIVDLFAWVAGAALDPMVALPVFVASILTRKWLNMAAVAGGVAILLTLVELADQHSAGLPDVTEPWQQGLRALGGGLAVATVFWFGRWVLDLYLSQKVSRPEGR